VALQQIVEETVAGLGYELVEIERSAGGLLRITIDNLWVEGVDRFEIPFVTVEDCEKVNRQLMFCIGSGWGRIPPPRGVISRY
jgi:ribosome maturation factor RimP